MSKTTGSARASCFLVHFFDIHCTTTTLNLLMRRFMEGVDMRLQIFLFQFEHWIKPLRVQLQEKSPTYDELSSSK